MRLELSVPFAVLCLCIVVGGGKAAVCSTPTPTTVSGTHIPKGEICSGDVIFEENFDRFDLSRWQHENTLAGGGNWEFQWYTNNRSISYVDNGSLHIRPQLLVDYVGDPNFVYKGHLDINGGAPAEQCTNPAFYGCVRDGSSSTALNPIVSARIRTVNSFNFKYGQVEVRAKLPAGDWLWPAIWLMPTVDQYSFWPSSGEIDMMESRGNKHLVQGGKNIGTQMVGSTLHWGTAGIHRMFHTESQNAKGFDEDFHRYQLIWTPNNITFSVDDVRIGTIAPTEGGFWDYGQFGRVDNPWKGGSKMAPFDQEFYLIINLACGGIGYFPDDAENPGGKPWKNNSPQASKDFWEGRANWLPTWNTGTDQSHLIVDYVKIRAL